MANSEKIRVVYSFARSGGTLVNRLLGSSDKCVVLSEVNPAGDALIPMADQCCGWFGLICRKELPAFEKLDYHSRISLLLERAQAKKQYLIIRDWSTINFLNTYHPHHNARSMLLEQDIYLQMSPSSANRINIVIARKAAFVFESIKRTFVHLKDLKESEFLEAYITFAEQVRQFPKIHLEQLQKCPRETVCKLLTILEIDSVDPEMLLNQFGAFTKCTGNNTLLIPQTSSYGGAIHLAKRLCSSRPVKEGTLFNKADEMMGYGQN